MSDTSIGIENTNVIDLVTFDPRTGEYALIMAAPPRWDDSDLQAWQLQEKINTYLSFAVDGQMIRTYPAAEGQPLRFQLDCKTAPTGNAAAVIAAATHYLQSEFGIRLIVKVLD